MNNRLFIIEYHYYIDYFLYLVTSLNIFNFSIFSIFFLQRGCLDNANQLSNFDFVDLDLN